jgi:hypothetical protein
MSTSFRDVKGNGGEFERTDQHEFTTWAIHGSAQFKLFSAAGFFER